MFWTEDEINNNNSDHESEFSGSESDNEQQFTLHSRLYNNYTSKDGKVKWSLNPFSAAPGRRSKHDIVEATRDVFLGSKKMIEPRDSIQLFMDNYFFDKLLKHTSEELERRRQ